MSHQEPHLQTPPEPPPSPSPFALAVMKTIFFFILTNIMMCLPYLWYLYMMFAGSWGNMAGAGMEYLLASFVLGLIPVLACLVLSNGFFKKNKILERHILPKYFKGLCIFWGTCLVIAMFTAVAPNNFVANTLHQMGSQRAYKKQEAQTILHVPTIMNRQPFYTVTRDNEEISLYLVGEEFLVNYQDSYGNNVIVSHPPTTNVKIQGSTLSYTSNEKGNDSWWDLNVSFILRDHLENGERIFAYTDAAGSRLLFQVEDSPLYYPIDMGYVDLIPDSVPNSSYGDSASYGRKIISSLYDAIPVNPLDPDTIIYGHIPYYDLRPTTTYGHFAVEFSQIPNHMNPPLPNVVSTKLSDQEGENYLSTWQPIQGSEIEYDFPNMEHAFQEDTVDIVYYYLQSIDAGYTRCSNVISMTREQYNQGGW